MKRRVFVLLLGGAMTASRALRAQQKAVPVIGFLGIASPAVYVANLAAFRRGLADTGYVVGQYVAMEFRWAEGNSDLLPALAADLVRTEVGVIVSTGGTLGMLAAKNATSTIPVVVMGG